MRVGGLTLGGRLDRYVGALFAGAYATSLLLVVGLAVIIDVASNLDYFAPWEDGSTAPASWILRYYALNTPFLYLQVAPFVTVSAALFTVVKLTRHGELVACLNAGVSARRAMLPVFCGAALAAAGMIAMREAATDSFGPQRDRLRHVLDTHTHDWRLRNVLTRDVYGNVVNAREFRPDRGEIVGLEMVGSRGPGSATILFVSAQRASFGERDGRPGWALEGGTLREETGDVSRRAELEWFDIADVTPRDLVLADKGDDRALELSLGELDELARRDPDNLQYQTLFHYNVTFPLANLVLLLITLPFLFGLERGKTVEGLGKAALMCVIYFAFDFIARSLGMEGSISPLWSGWVVVLVFGSLGAVLFEGLRT